MEKSFVLISIDCLFKLVSKEAKHQLKQVHLDRCSTASDSAKESQPAKSLENQDPNVLQEKVRDEDFFDFQIFKPVDESFQVLDELREAGFKIIITSDSSWHLRVDRLLKRFRFDGRFDCLATYQSVKAKKSDEDYFEQVKKTCGINETDEIWVVSTKLNKEILNAFRRNFKHVWINQEVADLVMFS